MIGLPYPKSLFMLSDIGLFEIIAIEDNSCINFLNKLESFLTFIEAIESSHWNIFKFCLNYGGLSC